MNNFLKYILDFIFPIECAGCGEEGQWLCDYCFSKIEFNKKQICPLCGRFLKLGYSCVCTVGVVSSNLKSEIKNLKSFVDVYITFVDLKKNPQVMKLIHKFQYGFIEDVAKELARMGIEFLRKNWKLEIRNLLFSENVIFIPVPLHKKRLLWRGFNQSELILREMGNLGDGKDEQEGEEGKEGEKKLEIRNWKLEICGDILARKKNTFFQGKIKMREKDRILNMRGAFEARGKLDGKAVVLFDDVITTGATMEECARVLKKAGATRVIAMAVGKG